MCTAQIAQDHVFSAGLTILIPTGHGTLKITNIYNGDEFVRGQP